MYGQLGDGTTDTRITPRQIGTESDWLAVATGSNHSISLKTTGTLWSWGDNSSGQLGLGDTISRTIPTLVTTETDWKSVAMYWYNSFGIKSAGTLWAWGYNGYGQLGLGDSGYLKDRATPTFVTTQSDWSLIAAGRYHTLAIKTKGTLWAWGCGAYAFYGQLGVGDSKYRATPAQVTTQSDWADIITGEMHTLGHAGHSW